MAKSRNGSHTQLTLYDFSDEEFLAVLQDQADGSGWAFTSDIAQSIKIDTKHPNNNVGIRLGWLKKYGVVERDERVGSPTKGAWRLTRVGEAVVNASFTTAQKNAMKNLGTEQIWEAAKTITDRYVVANAATASLVRRQFLLGHHRRRMRG